MLKLKDLEFSEVLKQNNYLSIRGGFSVDKDVDISVDTDLDTDVDIDVDKDLDVDLDFDSDVDISGNLATVTFDVTQLNPAYCPTCNDPLPPLFPPLFPPIDPPLLPPLLPPL